MLILYLVIIILLVLWRIRFSSEKDYLSKDRCNSIKGIFILMIFLTHSLQYISAGGFVFMGIDIITHRLLNFLGQLVVVMFLFYSGYGVAIQIKSKGETYVRQMPKRRILKTLLNFDIAVFLFVVLALLLSHPLSVRQVFLSLIAWDSVGNSNWYIFIILLCYLITYIVHRLGFGYACWGILLLSFLAMLLLSYFKQTHWYDTILSYPAGYIFASYRQRIESFLKRYYIYILVVFSSVFVLTHGYGPYLRGLRSNIMAIAFALIIVMITMKVEVGNRCLQWFGSNLFPLYIYQRIPMITISDIMGSSYVAQYPLFFLVACILTTSLIAMLYRFWRL